MLTNHFLDPLSRIYEQVWRIIAKLFSSGEPILVFSRVFVVAYLFVFTSAASVFGENSIKTVSFQELIDLDLAKACNPYLDRVIIIRGFLSMAEKDELKEPIYILSQNPKVKGSDNSILVDSMRILFAEGITPKGDPLDEVITLKGKLILTEGTLWLKEARYIHFQSPIEQAWSWIKGS